MADLENLEAAATAMVLRGNLENAEDDAAKTKRQDDLVSPQWLCFFSFLFWWALGDAFMMFHIDCYEDFLIII